MKTIIISDINSEAKTILPFGLRVGRAFETETDVLHIIDSRALQGEYGQMSDSQSITPGDKFSQKEIFEREKNRAEKKMDDILSAETSRLNYPLKVNRVIVENTVEEEIIKRTDEEEPSLFVISAEPDGTIFHSLDEILEVLKSAGAIAIIVPPEKKYSDFEKIILPVDFSTDEITQFTKVKFVIEKFKPLMNVVSVTEDKNYLKMQMKTDSWAKNAKKSFLPTNIKTNILEGKNFADTVMSFIQRNKPDLVMLSRKKQNPMESIFKYDAVNKIIKNVDVPSLVCFRN